MLLGSIVVQSKWISENMPVIIYPRNNCGSRAPPDPPRPRDRAKSYPHSSPRDPSERTGVAAKLSERRFFKFNPPETTTFPFGSAVERSILYKPSVSSNPPISVSSLFFVFFSAVREFKCPCLLFLSTWYIFRLYCWTYEDYCCSLVLYTHGGFVSWWSWMSFSVVDCPLLLYQVQHTAVLL